MVIRFNKRRLEEKSVEKTNKPEKGRRRNGAKKVFFAPFMMEI